MTDLSKVDKMLAQQAASLAFDIMRNRLHLPLKDGKINVDLIEEEIVIGIYTKALLPIAPEVIDLAIDTIQDLMDKYKKQQPEE